MHRKRTFAITLSTVLLLGIPASAAASGPVERIVERHHKTEIVEIVTDDVCGDVGGGLGLRFGVFRNVERPPTITVFEDRFQVVDVENGTYSYDFDDPSIPDVAGYRYTSPFNLVVNKNDNVLVTQILHEHLPGSPDGIRFWERWHLTWKDGAPFVERYFWRSRGAPDVPPVRVSEGEGHPESVRAAVGAERPARAGSWCGADGHLRGFGDR